MQERKQQLMKKYYFDCECETCQSSQNVRYSTGQFLNDTYATHKISNSRALSHQKISSTQSVLLQDRMLETKSNVTVPLEIDLTFSNELRLLRIFDFEEGN